MIESLTRYGLLDLEREREVTSFANAKAEALLHLKAASSGSTVDSPFTMVLYFNK